MKFQITFLGANSLFGRVVSALLSKTPSVRILNLYDEVENPKLGSNNNPSCVVQWHRGKEELTAALQGSDIVVIGDENKVILNSEKDALISTASKVVDFIYAVAQTSPKAMVVVAASPLNLMVPLAGYVLKENGCYDGRKLLGVTSVDTLRANAIYSEYIAQPNSILPVVGGASPQTRVPIFSHARPSLDLPEEDLHLLIEKIKSFDLNMDGLALKESTLERAYATVRLVNSLLSGLQEEPSTKEMALAKTSLIPEVNYFSLPVDLGKFGIERTFGLPQLSPLEAEMINYAIINLNNDLTKAQDLYASFRPCFEMLKSIVGGSGRFNDLMKEDGTLLVDSKIDLKKKKDQKMKSNKRKRNEAHIRNRKRTRANKFPILHCPAPEVVTDMPIEEKFGKIERVHKKLQIHQILQERNAYELPMLKSNKVSDVGQSESQLNDSGSPLENVLNNCVAKKENRTHENIDSVPILLNSAEATKDQQPFLDSKIPKIIDWMDLQNNSNAMHKAANQKFNSKNMLESTLNLKDDIEISQNVKVIIDLKCKIKNNNLYEHLQPHAQSQPSRIEMMKSLMLQKQKENQKTKALSLSDSSFNKNKMEYLKKKAMELKTSNITRFSNAHSNTNPQSSEKHKGVEDESNNDTILEKHANKNSNMEKLPRLEKIEKTNMTMLENDSIDEEYFNLLKNNTGEKNGTGISEQKIKTEIETKGDQEMVIPKEDVVIEKKNQEDDSRNPLVNKVDALKANGDINYEQDQRIGMTAYSENNLLVERREKVHESCNLKKIYNEKAFKEDEKHSLNTLTCTENENDIQIASDKNVSTACNKASEINENKIIPEEKVTVTEDENGLINDKGNFIVSNINSKINNQIEADEKNDKHFQVKSRAESMNEVEKQFIKSSLYEVTKGDNEMFDEEISKLISEIADSNEHKKEINNQKFSFPSGQILDEGKVPKEIDVQDKLEELGYLSKRQERDKLIENNQKIDVANTAKVCYNVESVNKIREITIQKLKEPLKYPNPSKQEKASDTEMVEETVMNKERKKTMVMEETEEIEKINVCDLESKVPESIEVFNYEPKKMHDTRNITNINEMIQSLVKTDKPEANSELPSVDHKSLHNINDRAHVVNSNSNEVKVINLKKKAGQLTVEHKQKSKDKKLKKDDQRANASINLELKKPAKERPFPFLNKITEIPKYETFDKSKWLKQRTQSVTKGIKNGEAKGELKTIDESKALTVYSRNINESFTKRIQKGHGSNKTTDNTKSISYAIDTKSKKDELSKRYTVLKKGQLCNMIKDDINANELKAKLYHKSLMKATIHPSVKRDDKNITNTKDLSFTELPKSPSTNKETYRYNSEKSSAPSLNVLKATKKVSYDITKDANNLNNSKKSNNNAITLKNKSFLNLVINRISKRSPTLNETSETIGVRGSHYGSGTYSKKPDTSDEQKIQQQIKKAKDQLNMTRFKNDKRISSGLSGSLPVVSNELGGKRQPVTGKEQNKSNATDDLTENMVRSKNKIQLMKEKYQRLKNANSPTKKAYVTNSPTGANFVSNKDKKKVLYGIKNPLIESVKSSSKSNPEPKIEGIVMKQDEIVSKQDELSSNEKPVKEITMNASGESKSEPHDLVPNEKDDSVIDVSIERKLGINCSEVFNKNYSTETEQKCSELSQIPNPTASGDNEVTTVTHKKSSHENKQSSQDKNKSIKECLEKQPELPKTIEEEGNIMANVKPLKDETTTNVEKQSPSICTQLNPKKKVFPDRAQEISNFKPKENIKDIFHSKDSTTTASKEKSQKFKFNLAHKNVLMSNKSPQKKSKSVNEHLGHAALKAVFSSRPTAGDLIKMKQEQKTSETDRTNSRTDKVPSLNFGVRAVVGNKLIIPRQSTASALLIDPDIEKRPATNRKEIHPSLMHAAKPYHSQNTDLTKLKTNFYSRWTPENLKLRDNKERGTHISKNEGIQKNPFVSGKINLTSDLFKAYMKKNRNSEFTNSNVDVQFLHQSGQLVSIPQQGVSANTSRINDQRVAFSTLEANSEKKKNPKKVTLKSKPKASISEKTAKSRISFFNKPTTINKNLKESVSKEPSVKDKNILHSSNKSQSLTTPKYKTVLNKSNQKLNHAINPFHYRDKEVDLKRIHLLKAFQNQEKNELKFEELQRNYKKQLCRTPENALKTQNKEISKETPNRLQMLKRHSLESTKHAASEDSRRIKKPFSAPADYHPSFPLSKPKKCENNIKKGECGNSTLKKRWTQLLDIFQSVITTEKKNWEHDSPERNLLVAEGSHLSNNAVVPKAKIILRETFHNPDSTAKRVQSYYRRHSVGGSKFQNSYSLSNRTNKM